MFCPNCGNKLADGIAFCPSCGNPIKPVENTNNAYGASPVTSQPGYVAPVVPKAEVLTPQDRPGYVAPVVPKAEVLTPQDRPGYVAPVAPKAEVLTPQDNREYAAPVESGTDVLSSEEHEHTYATPVIPKAEVLGPSNPVSDMGSIDVGNGKKGKKNKKSKGKKKKPVLIAVFSLVAVLLVAAIVVAVVIFSKPEMTIARATKKTILDSSGFAFELYVTGEGKIGEGKVYFGEDYKDSGFYLEGDNSEMGYHDNTVYTNYGSYDLEEDIKAVNDVLDEYGFGITVEDALNRVINGEIQEDALLEIYEEESDNLQAFLEDELDMDVELPDAKEIKSSAGNLFKDLPEGTIEFEKESKKGKKIYKYEIDTEKLMIAVMENLSEDENFDDFFDTIEYETGSDIDDIIDEIKEMDIPNVEGEVVIEKGYLVEFSAEIDGDGFKIKFKDINDTVVDQKTMDDIEEREDDYYEDDYYEDDYYEDDYYEEDYYEEDYIDAYVDVNRYDLYMEIGDTEEVLVECWGEDLPQQFKFNVEYPGSVSVEWGEWESDTSCYLYITADDECDDNITIYLRDEYGNDLDTIDVYISAE